LWIWRAGAPPTKRGVGLDEGTITRIRREAAAGTAEADPARCSILADAALRHGYGWTQRAGVGMAGAELAESQTAMKLATAGSG
jgi:hypothetical protein